MRLNWPLRQGIIPSHTFETDAVLVEFNGPQVVLATYGESRYLNVASDENEAGTVVRWICAQVSDAEVLALRRGDTTVRACILKDSVYIVDTDAAGVVLQQFLMRGMSLPEDALPAIESRLPDESTYAFKENVIQPEIKIDGPDTATHTIGLDLLAELTKRLQKLWRSLGREMMGGVRALGLQTELRLAGFGKGSVILRLASDDKGAFADTAEKYTAVLESLANPLEGVYKNRTKRTKTALNALLQTIRRHKLSVYLRWDDQGSLLTADAAKVAAYKIVQTQWRDKTKVIKHGYFIGFNIKQERYDFFDIELKKRFKGEVSPVVMQPGHEKITIGDRERYKATFSVQQSTQGPSLKERLVLEEIERDDGQLLG